MNDIKTKWDYARMKQKVTRPKTARIATYLDSIVYYRKQGYTWSGILEIVQKVIPDIVSAGALRLAVTRAQRRRASGSLDPDQRQLPPPEQYVQPEPHPLVANDNPTTAQGEEESSQDSGEESYEVRKKKMLDAMTREGSPERYANMKKPIIEV